MINDHTADSIEYTEFEIPAPSVIARAALAQLRHYGSHIVIHGRDQSMSIAVSEGEALDIAVPEKDDVYFPIDQLIASLSESRVTTKPERLLPA